MSSPTPPVAVPPELASLGVYQVIRELGRGGMGVVYLAKNNHLERLEVLKVMNTAGLDRPGSVERFQREMRSAARLNHPNVVTAYSAHQVGHYLVFAMEYVEGDDLTKVVRAHGRLPVAHAAYYTHQAARGLQHAYEKGMVHRDIKPSNLILQKVGKKHTVKILDFGLAKASVEGEAGNELTGFGKMLGTPDFVAPEQTRDAANADVRADLYSLGCTLYYLLAGNPPFQGRGMYEVLEAHQFHAPRPVNLDRPEIPAELAAIVDRMMAKDPAARFQVPQEVIIALSPYIRTGGSPMSSGSIPQIPSDPDLRPPSDPGPGSRPGAETAPAGSTGPVQATPPKLLVPRQVDGPSEMMAKLAIELPPPRPDAGRRPGSLLGEVAPWALWGVVQVTAFLYAAAAVAYAGGTRADGPTAPAILMTGLVLGLYAVFAALTREAGGGFRLRWRDWRTWAGAGLLAAVAGASVAEAVGFHRTLPASAWVATVFAAVGLGAALPRLIHPRAGGH